MAARNRPTSLRKRGLQIRSRTRQLQTFQPNLCGPEFMDVWEQLGRTFCDQQVELFRSIWHLPKDARVEVYPQNLPFALAERIRQIMGLHHNDRPAVEAETTKLIRNLTFGHDPGEVDDPDPLGHITIHLPGPSSPLRGRKRKPETFKRDIQIVGLKESAGLSYGQIANKLGTKKNIVVSAYTRMCRYREQLHEAYKLLRKYLPLCIVEPRESPPS